MYKDTNRFVKFKPHRVLNEQHKPDEEYGIWFGNILKGCTDEDTIKRPQLRNLSFCIQTGLSILKEINETEEKFDNHDLIILSIYRKLLEQLDALYLLIDHYSESGATIILRSIFETFLSVVHILRDNTKIKERATCYYIAYVHEEMKIVNESLSGLNKTLLTKEELEMKYKQLSEVLQNDRFIDIHNEWTKHKKLKPKLMPKWYSLFNGPSNIKKLAKIIGQEELYNHIYSVYSIEAHGYSALKDLRKSSNGIKFSDLRSNQEFTAHLLLGFNIFIISTLYLCKKYIPSLTPELVNIREQLDKDFKLVKHL